MSDSMGGLDPDSINNTFQFFISVNRLAIAHPAEPAPTIMKSNSKFSSSISALWSGGYGALRSQYELYKLEIN
ncbi:hypothetical protein PGB90_004705 [Kerria lacca]